MIPFGKILKFKSYDAETLERMKNDLALSAPLPFWQYCKGYYNDHAKRDPYIEELRLLDGLFLSLQAETRLVRLQELYTNDGVVAQTYQDMMQKRKELFGGVSAQISLGELLSLADNYLLRAGKKPSAPFPLTFWEDSSTPGMIPSYGNAKKSDDLFALLRPASFEIAQEPDLKGLLADPEFASEIKALQKIERGGILATLLRECTAFKLELDGLCSHENPSFAIALTENFLGDYLIRLPIDAEERASALAKKHGCIVKPIAHASAGGDMTVRIDQKEIFKLETAFLKTLFPQKILRAKLKNEKDGSIAPIKLASIPAPEGFSGVQASCAPKGAFFTGAIQTALAAVILQTLNGTAYWEQRLSISLQIPERADDSVGGDLLSIMIGLYRLQAELGIPSSSRMVYDEAVSSPTVTVVAIGTGDADLRNPQDLSDALGGVEIPTQENGLPSFDKLREILESLIQKNQNEDIENARFIESNPEKKDSV